MKTILFFAVLVSSLTVNAQSLKEALYGGKLKVDTGTVLKKNENWMAKIDTSTKKPVEPAKPVVLPAAKDSSVAGIVVAGDSVAVGSTTTTTEVALTATTPEAVPAVVAPMDNNKIWKNYMEEFTGTIRTEVLTSKKVKSGTYSVLIEYEIGLDGTVTVNSVSASPESSFLEEQVKNRLTLTAPQMIPLLNAQGKPRKAIKKYTLILSKG